MWKEFVDWGVFVVDVGLAAMFWILLVKFGIGGHKIPLISDWSAAL